MNNFVFQNSTKIYFGNSLASLSTELAKYGTKVLLVYGKGSIKKTGLYEEVVGEIKKAGLSGYELSGVPGNPTVDVVRQGVYLCRRAGIDVILAVGGGSVMDTAKAIAGSVPYNADPWELITDKAQIDEALPLITIPTLAATGSEMNAGCVITNPETEEKLGWHTEPLRPKVSFLLPRNTYTVSPYQTACAAADIFSHTMETYLAKDPVFQITIDFMESIMRCVLTNTPIAMEYPDDEIARENLMWASTWAINDFIDTGNHTPWTCHPLEHELSAKYNIPHGHGLAILTPAYLRHILNEDTAPYLLSWAVNVMGVKPKKRDEITIVKKGIKKLEKFYFEILGLESSLKALGIEEERLEEMADAVLAWKGKEGVLNGFVPLTKEDIVEIYRSCL